MLHCSPSESVRSTSHRVWLFSAILTDTRFLHRKPTDGKFSTLDAEMCSRFSPSTPASPPLCLQKNSFNSFSGHRDVYSATPSVSETLVGGTRRSGRALNILNDEDKQTAGLR
ncbi:hypothetical protein F2P81_012900 [Scophthalmus maximus]|uniref:Uncharacterized protein n=1 Tax=Scophthalmus maximus TaxID=52904 RepID=A0A6A4SYQ3_SCOMX|nr:hypothetical protein F2P81_012900 [Scophthalmus maximus]